MNNSRRKRISDVIKWLDEIDTILNDILNEEMDAFDSMPEGLQSSENGTISEEAQECLENAIDSIGDALVSIEEI